MDDLNHELLAGEQVVGHELAGAEGSGGCERVRERLGRRRRACARAAAVRHEREAAARQERVRERRLPEFWCCSLNI